MPRSHRGHVFEASDPADRAEERARAAFWQREHRDVREETFLAEETELATYAERYQDPVRYLGEPE